MTYLEVLPGVFLKAKGKVRVKASPALALKAQAGVEYRSTDSYPRHYVYENKLSASRIGLCNLRIP